jgi:hypothetical protein
MDLEPLTTIASPPAAIAAPQKTIATPEKFEAPKPDVRPALSVVTVAPSLASVEPQMQRRRDDDRRRILEDELQKEEQSLDDARNAATQEQQNPKLVAAVRLAQQATDPTPSQLVEFRNSIERASGRIRGLQATVAEHEKNIEALKKELGALKP